MLIRSVLAAGIVQDTFTGEAGEGEGGEEETTGGYFYFYFCWYFYRSGQKVFRLHQLLNFIRKTLTRACLLETDVRISRFHRHDYNFFCTHIICNSYNPITKSQGIEL